MAQAGVACSLLFNVLSSSAPGCYLHDEIGGLALHGDDVPVVVLVCLWVGVEGYEQVWGYPIRRRGALLPGQVPLASDDGGFGVAEVLDQVVDTAAEGEVVEASHVLWLPLRRIRKFEAVTAFSLG